MRSLQFLGLFVAVIAAGACGEKPSMMTASAGGTGEETGEESETGGGSGSTTGSMTTVPGTSDGTTTGGGPAGTSGPQPTTGEATSGTTDGGFITPPDGGVAGQCDPKTQDCPEGQKCTAISDVPGEPWGVNVCVDAPGQGVVGDPCDVEGGKYTGVDNCVEGTICLLTDDEGMGGVCVEFCSANDTCPNTPTANCVVYNDGSLPICLGSCDPIVQDCPEGQACYNSAGDQFVCFKESSMPGEGGVGQECQYINQCQKGGFCAATGSVTGCDPMASGCCTPFCPVSGGNGPCQAGEECTPFFEMGMAPPQYEDVGVCVIPA